MNRCSTLKSLSVTLAVGFVTGCAGPTRSSDPAAFTLLQSGQIQSTEIAAFTDCVMDGFNDANGNIFWRTSVRQQKRADGFRVETFDESSTSLMMSADVLNNGRVSLHESVTAALVNTSKEREAFSKCLKRFGS
jgi:hypothetical protein